MKKTVNPKSLKNLKPFKSGDEWNGNAGGRPKKRPITDEYYARAEKPLPEKLRKQINREAGEEVLLEGATWAQANALKRFIQTLEMDGHRSAKEIREAIEGKAPERLEISGPERKEITIRILHDRKKTSSSE
jgi:hypothetical protein